MDEFTVRPRIDQLSPFILFPVELIVVKRIFIKSNPIIVAIFAKLLNRVCLFF